MKKNNVLKLALILLMVLTFNLLVFLLTQKFTTTFWVSYAFVMISYGFVALAVFNVGNPKQKVFYGLSYFGLTICYHALALVLGVIFMLAKNMGYIAPFIIQSLVLILYLGLNIIGLMGNNIVKSSLERDQNNKHFLKRLAFKVSVLEQTVTDESLKGKLNNLFDRISSSPFHTEPGVEEVEQRLVAKVEELSAAVHDADYELANNLTDEAQKLVAERNNYLKLNH